MIPIVPQGIQDRVHIYGPKGLEEEVKHALDVVLGVGDPLPRVVGGHQEPGKAIPSVGTDLWVPAVLGALSPNHPPAVHMTRFSHCPCFFL